MEYAKQFCPPNKAASRRTHQARGTDGWEIPWSRHWRERENQQLLFRARTRRKGWRRTWRSGGGVQASSVLVGRPPSVVRRAKLGALDEDEECLQLQGED